MYSPSEHRLLVKPIFDYKIICFIDNLLREKVNLEVEEFKNSLHEILNNQLHLVENLLKLSQQPSGIISSQVDGGTF